MISASRRTPVALTAAVAAALAAALGIVLHRAGRTSLDTWLFERSYAHIGGTAARAILHFSDPGLSFSAIVLVAFTAAVTGRWRLLALALVGPGSAVLLTEEVLKPVVARYMAYPGVPDSVARELYVGAYPSGHAAGVASAAVLLFVAAARSRRARQRALGGLLTAWVLLAATGLTRYYYHYATDTIGGIAVAVAVVLGAALAIDAALDGIAARQSARKERLPAEVDS